MTIAYKAMLRVVFFSSVFLFALTGVGLEAHAFKCPYGQYGLTKCLKCPAGTYSGKKKLVTKLGCKPCPKNHISAPGARVCTPLHKDAFYTSKVGSKKRSDYKICPAGSITTGTGCIKCPPGTAGSGNARYWSLRKGYCKPCSSGKYNHRPGATSCKAIPPGYQGHGVSKKKGPIERTLTFMPFVGLKKRVRFTFKVGFHGVRKCLAGYYGGSGGKCFLCPVGKTSRAGAKACKPCPKGTVSKKTARNARACVPCPAGWYSTGKSCAKCPAHTYNPRSGQMICKRCPMHLVSSEGARSCKPCSSAKRYGKPFGQAQFYIGHRYSGAPTYRTRQCVICPGTRAPNGQCLFCRPNFSPSARGCLPCKLGWYSTGNTHCSPCPAGTYRGQKDATCKPCRKGTYARGMGSGVCCPLGMKPVPGTDHCRR